MGVACRKLDKWCERKFHLLDFAIQGLIGSTIAEHYGDGCCEIERLLVLYKTRMTS